MSTRAASRLGRAKRGAVCACLVCACLVRACLVCACLVCAPCHAEDARPARDTTAAEVVVRHVVRKCFTSLVHASGYLVPRATAVVMFPVSGYRITEMRAKVGDRIERGDLVARATPVSEPADRPGATTEVALTSLVSGVVMQSTAFVGMPTSEKAPPLFTIAVDGAFEAAVAVPGVHILELAAGQPARVTMGDGSVLDARVRRLPAVVDPASQMGTARLSIEAGGALEPGRFVLATIEARRSCGIGVPSSAVRRTSAGTYVQVVDKGVIARREVTLGLADESDREITAGLAEGDVVVAGTGATREGDRVEPVFADPQDAR